MDSFLKKTIGQDQPDRQEIAAFGRKPLAAGEKIPSILKILSKKNKNRIHSFEVSYGEDLK